MKYIKKPVEIEAVQFTYPPTKEFLDFCGSSIKNIRKNRHLGAIAEADIVTLEDGSDNRARHVVTECNWVIRGVAGEFYACRDDIFKATYYTEAEYAAL